MSADRGRAVSDDGGAKPGTTSASATAPIRRESREIPIPTRQADPTHPLPTERRELLARLAADKHYDLAIIGGGATGLGVALDAASRGYSVVLVDAHDFAQGTSSRSTKLVHGGVRYLAQGDIAMVREGLHERRTLLENAPHLAQPLAFVMPGYKFWETPFYGVGLLVYDLLAGSSGLGKTAFLSRKGTLATLPGVRAEGLKSGVRYWDGQFDDARLAIALARTAALQGALLVNHCPVVELLHQNGEVSGFICSDAETGRRYRVQADCVVNATGVWVDGVRQMDSDAVGAPPEPMVAPSQGVHIVVDREFLPGGQALLVPKTADGRVLFAVPWLGKVILGTTDTPRRDLALEPEPFADEVAFLLDESARYLARAPTRADVRSVWVGLRPLVAPPRSEGEPTKTLSRAHTVLVSKSGLVTVTGGKWTTYRSMAVHVLETCVASGLLAQRGEPRTAHLPLVGAEAAGAIAPGAHISDPPGIHLYGNEGPFVASGSGGGRDLLAGVGGLSSRATNCAEDGVLTEAMVRFAVTHEYARTVEDVLARRSRLLFLDAARARDVAAEVARLVHAETGNDPQLHAFVEQTHRYQQLP
ncbi:glycerol-3-phosphate dehydrogenase/oxidase [soil metagenome]